MIRRARERTRAVLELARLREDRSLARSPDSEASAANARERERADATLALEHARTDAALGDERALRLAALIQLLASERDETDHALATERLTTDRMLAVRDDVLAGVSHDIRGQLNMLLLDGSCIVAMRPDDHEVVRLADRMLRSAAQMDNLLADLLDVASMDSGRLQIQPALADLVPLVRTAVELFEPAASGRSVHIAFAPQASSIAAPVDARRITRVVMNLLGNAIKFTPEHGEVTLSIRRVAAEVEIAVADTGPGIPPDELESIFERFQRAGTASRKAGYGLGLYIACTIVNAHGGRIWAENNADRGATFRLRVPADQP